MAALTVGATPVGATPGGGGVRIRKTASSIRRPRPSGPPANAAVRDQTGNFLGNAPAAAGQGSMPVVVPNPFDNTLIIKGSSQEIEQIKDLLRQLDVAPRQIQIGRASRPER